MPDRRGRGMGGRSRLREVTLVLRQAQDDPELRRRVEIVASIRSRFVPGAWRATSYPAWRCLVPNTGLRRLAREPLPPYGTISSWRPSGHFTSPRSATHAPATAGHRRRRQASCAGTLCDDRMATWRVRPSRPVLSRRRLRRPRGRQSETGPQGARGFEGRCAVGLSPGS